MPYIAPGSSQSCIPRKAVASTVLEQTRRKNATGKKSRTKESGDPTASTSKLDSSPRTIGDLDTSAATSQLAETLEVTHIDKPALPIPNSASSTSLAPSSSDLPSDASSSAVSPVISNGTRASGSSESDDAVMAYKSALYTYTREKLLTAKGSGSPGKKGSLGYSQFGAKQSGMQKLAAKKALARELNA